MRVHVIGGGFTGLVAAYHALKRGHEVTVYEKDQRLGGMIQTLETPFGLVETAANAFIWNPEISEIAGKIGVELKPAKTGARKRYIFNSSGTLCFPWPSLFRPVFFLRIFFFAFRYVFFRSLVAPRPFESIRVWGTRVFGSSITVEVLEPALQGIYAGNGTRLSASLIMGRFFSKQPVRMTRITKRGIQPPPRGSVAPEKGMGAFIGALHTYLKGRGVTFVLGSEVKSRAQLPSHEFVIHTVSHSHVRSQFSPYSNFAETMSALERISVITATLFFQPNKTKDLRGFGVLFGRDQGARALGVLFNEDIFAKRSQVRSETWIYGGEESEHLMALSNTELVATALKDRKTLQGSSDEPLHYQVTKWKDALPYYTVELERMLFQLTNKDFEEDQKILWLGTDLGSLGLSRLVAHIKTRVEASL